MMASEASPTFCYTKYTGNYHFGPTKIVTPYFSVYNFMTPLFFMSQNYDPPVYLGPPFRRKMTAPLFRSSLVNCIEYATPTNFWINQRCNMIAFSERANNY